ncbi:glutaminyl-peptide cyclotransferase [Chloroflexales bacterium ZM16-3]|nr:glutaminyl-peptide cyclotransferase [Chloroflexales bacterium ZM16-3]
MRRNLLVRAATLLAAVLLSYGCAGVPSSAASIGEVSPNLLTPLVVPPTVVPAPTTAPAVSPAPSGSIAYSYQVVRRYPHDIHAWTEGLVYVGDDTLYESTGEYADSSLRLVQISTGEVLQIADLGNPNLYGEGISPVGDTIFQLTWQNCLGLLYNRASFAKTGQFSFPTSGGQCAMEGWGLTYDGSQLIMSDGTNTLSFIDPAATIQSGQMAIVRQVKVTDSQGEPVRNLNELEYIHGSVFANVWLTNRIVQIDPATGAVIGELDLSGLLSAADRQGSPTPDVLNGIAYDAAGDRLFITGKYWPALFEIKLQPPLGFRNNLPLVVRG